MSVDTVGYQFIRISEREYIHAFEEGKALQFLWTKFQGTGMTQCECGDFFLRFGHAIWTAHGFHWYNHRLLIAE